MSFKPWKAETGGSNYSITGAPGTPLVRPVNC